MQRADQRSRSRGGEIDIDNLKAGAAGAKAEDLFMSAASPGRGVALLSQRLLQDARGISVRDRGRDAVRVRGDRQRRPRPAARLSRPRVGRHVQFVELSLEEFRRKARLHVEALNHAVRNIPPEQMRMHLCWGNYEAPHQMDCRSPTSSMSSSSHGLGAISFEAANPRHAHEWAVFETVKLPDGKVLIPGVLESKSNFIEHPELVAQRIGRYATLVGRENVMLGTDCGYGTWVGQAAVDPDVVWGKLAAMAEGARLASRRFWN